MQNKTHRRKNTLAIAAILVIASGSILYVGDGGEPTVNAEGFVFLDNQPLANAELIFFSIDGAKQITTQFGKSDATGQYQIGVLPGEYRVVVRKNLRADGTQINDVADSNRESSFAEANAGGATLDDGQMAAMMAAKDDRDRLEKSPRKTTAQAPGDQITPLPEIYSSPEQTVLTVVVSERGNLEADLFLDWPRVEQTAAMETDSTVQ